jgi:hypothetical protein
MDYEEIRLDPGPVKQQTSELLVCRLSGILWKTGQIASALFTHRRNYYAYCGERRLNSKGRTLGDD